MTTNATKTRRAATIYPAAVVDYHGTMTAMHGLWYVASNYGHRLSIRDAWGNHIICRTSSVSVVDLPHFTEARAVTLTNLRESRDGRIPAGRIRTWLIATGLIEPATDRPRAWQLTYLGLTAADALRARWYSGRLPNPVVA